MASPEPGPGYEMGEGSPPLQVIPEASHQFTAELQAQRERGQKVREAYATFGVKSAREITIYPGHHNFHFTLRQIMETIGGVSSYEDLYGYPPPQQLAPGEQTLPQLAAPQQQQQTRKPELGLGGRSFMVIALLLVGILLLTAFMSYESVSGINAQMAQLQTYQVNQTIPTIVGNTTQFITISPTENQSLAVAAQLKSLEAERQKVINNAYLVFGGEVVALILILVVPAILAYLNMKKQEEKQAKPQDRLRQLYEELLQMHKQVSALLAYFNMHPDELPDEYVIELRERPWAAVCDLYEKQNKPLDADVKITEIYQIGLRDVEMKKAFYARQLGLVESPQAQAPPR